MTPSADIEVKSSATGQRGVFAARALAAGAFIGRFEGDPVAVPTRLSLQTGADVHIEPTADCPLAFLNHACDPVAAFRSRGGRDGRDLHALRDIPAGGEITVDYNCHEAAMKAPFACGCGSPACVGRVAGWNRLDARQRAARKDRAAAWLDPGPRG